MVERSVQLDLLFAALSDSTRRDILARITKVDMSISAIAKHYKLTFAAVSKHIKVLEKAGLITKRRQGKEQIVIIVPRSVNLARSHIEHYARMWGDRFNRLENVLKEQS